jgi:hypothetical protein
MDSEFRCTSLSGSRDPGYESIPSIGCEPEEIHVPDCCLEDDSSADRSTECFSELEVSKAGDRWRKPKVGYLIF